MLHSPKVALMPRTIRAGVQVPLLFRGSSEIVHRSRSMVRCLQSEHSGRRLERSRLFNAESEVKVEVERTTKK